MGCPRSTELELRVTGRLSDEASRSLDQHLDTCTECQQELGFLQALRLSVAAHPTQIKGPHLADEQLAALADGAMDAGQREAAEAHLATCSGCASSLASIERAMDEALDPDGQPVMAPPTQLLNRAIRIGAPGRSAAPEARADQARPGLLDRLFGAPLLLRLGVAAGVAALILALTVVLSQPDPVPVGEAGGPRSDAPKVADAPAAGPSEPAPAPTLQPDQPDTPAPVVAEGPTDGPKPAPAPDETKDEPSVAPKRAASRDWLAAMDPQQRAGLAAQARPVITRPGADLGQGQALAEPDAKPGLSDGYVIGRALGFLERFGPHVGKSAELRGLVSETLLSLEPAIRTALPRGGQADRLVDFATGLGGQLAAGQIAADAAGRRLQVFCVALREALSGQARIRSGMQLGLLVQGWQTSANADQLGIEVSLQDAAALKRARQIIRTDQGLSDQMRQSVLSDLSQVDKARRQRQGKQRAARILEEITRLDQRVRAVR